MLSVVGRMWRELVDFCLPCCVGLGLCKERCIQPAGGTQGVDDQELSLEQGTVMNIGICVKTTNYTYKTLVPVCNKEGPK